MTPSLANRSFEVFADPAEADKRPRSTARQELGIAHVATTLGSIEVCEILKPVPDSLLRTRPAEREPAAFVVVAAREGV